MLDDAAAQLVALRHYRTKWFGQAWGAISGAWQTEYDSLVSGAFAPVTILSVATEGFNPSGKSNFEQAVRLAALQVFRAELDPAFALAVFAPASVLTGPRMLLPDYSNAIAQ